MADIKEPTKTYRGNCHCGAFVYEVDVPEIKSTSECNCSICTKKGYLGLYPLGRDSFRVVKGAVEDLTNYTFAEGTFHHKFCPTCATPLMITIPSAPPDNCLGINIHSIQGVNTWALEREYIDYASKGCKYEVPAYTGRLPAEEVEGGKIYTGNCHCGAVQVALASPLLDETFKDMVGECNCSICERNAYIWVWPRRELVALHGDPDDIGRYYCASKLIGKTFCKKCGVQMTNEPASRSDEEIAAMSEQQRKTWDMVSPMHPVNLRVLNGIDLKDFKGKILHMEGANAPPFYENP
ncbi:hypothetical protein AK830_g4636 [Neonectria ditissima]|uniref:CENP-V/GFA domain-containing protein n=1 Tax=Neonectria ditissima TaxID=78410 RepID=A0A0P7BKW7_9HYPO|nr:hypothetical protein AK830_g4636 [Neonectria ditissima]